MTYLELSLESIKYEEMLTNSTKSTVLNVGSLKSFIYNPVDMLDSSSSSSISSEKLAEKYVNYSTRDIEQVMFLSSSESNEYVKA